MNEFSIRAVEACLALDSRGTPTVSCQIQLSGGGGGTAIVPSGASTGTHEAVELRDDDAHFGGRGVMRAIDHVRRIIGPAVIGVDAREQETVDTVLERLDGTEELRTLGANATLSVSIATALAAADGAKEPLFSAVGDGRRPLLPLPMINIISGGAHAGRAVDVQDFLVIPVGAATFSQAIEWTWRVREGTRTALRDAGHAAHLVADEGGFGPPLPSNQDALELLVQGIERSGLRPGTEVAIALDVAANQFSSGENYRFAAEQRQLSATELLDEIAGWCSDYPIVSLEDVLGEDDWDGWRLATSRLGGAQLLGDDLFVTNADRLERGINQQVANAVLVKPNQTGTLSRARAVVRRAHSAGYATVLSGRSGETEDSWLADLAVGWRTGQIKVGSLARSERTAKWNRLLRLESELGTQADYAGLTGESGLRTPAHIGRKITAPI